jgi:tetratricopeptide (TPR) repeat protein
LEYFRKCIKDCDDALAVDDKCALAFLRKGQALLKMGKEADAKRTFEKGAKEAVGDVESMILLRKAARGESIEPSIQTNESASSSSNQPNQKTSGSKSSESSQYSSQAMYEERLDPGMRSGGSSEIEEGSESSLSGSNNLSLPDSLKEHIDELDTKQVEALAHVASKGMVVNGVGNAAIDQRIAFGNLQVNTGKFEMGVKIFTELIKEYPDTVAAFLGRGTALAMKGNLLEASIDFSRALKLSPNNTDALKRRAQVLSALGRDSEALVDLNTAVELSKDADSYHQRGIAQHKLRNYRRAVTDFSTASKLDHANKSTYNYLGLCFICLGDAKSAVENYKKVRFHQAFQSPLLVPTAIIRTIHHCGTSTHFTVRIHSACYSCSY